MNKVLYIISEFRQCRCNILKDETVLWWPRLLPTSRQDHTCSWLFRPHLAAKENWTSWIIRITRMWDNCTCMFMRCVLNVTWLDWRLIECCLLLGCKFNMTADARSARDARDALLAVYFICLYKKAALWPGSCQVDFCCPPFCGRMSGDYYLVNHSLSLKWLCGLWTEALCQDMRVLGKGNQAEQVVRGHSLT